MAGVKGRSGRRDSLSRGGGRPPDPNAKKHTSFRLSEQTKQKLKRLAEKWDISQANVIEKMIEKE